MAYFQPEVIWMANTAVLTVLYKYLTVSQLTVFIHREGFHCDTERAFPHRETVRFVTSHSMFRTITKPVPHNNKSRFPH